MAIIINNTATLIHGPNAPGCGMPPQVWLPGKNPLDLTYWDEVKDNFMVKRWLKVKVKPSRKVMLEVDLEADMPDPTKPPSLEDLLKHAEDFEVQEMLDDPTTPDTWKPVLQTALGQFKAKAAQAKADAERRRLEVRMGEDKNLADLPVRLAVPKVEAETDPKVLTAWYDAEDRSTVRKAIDKRMGELEARAEPDPPEALVEPETAVEEPSEGL